MKNNKNFCIYDFSDYAEEITGDELFKINGGAEIENTIKAQANAKPGDTVTRDDGTTHTIWQGDIDWAKEIMASREEPCSTQQTNNSETPSISTQTIEKKEEELSVQIQNSWTYNPDELDSDKRFNAKDINGQHLMTIACDDKINFEDFASYYITVGKYGSVGTKVYDGIGLTDKNGNIINVLKDDGPIRDYAEYLNPSYKHNVYSPIKHGKNSRYNSKLNSDYYANNQFKSEREIYFEKENSRYGFTADTGFVKTSSKTIKKGPAGAVEVDLITANVAWMYSPDYKKIGLGVNVFSVNGEIGFQTGDKRFTVGSGLGIGGNLGFLKIQNSIYVDLGPFKGLHFSFEKDGANH